MAEGKHEASMNNMKLGAWLLLTEAQRRPNPGSVDCPLLWGKFSLCQQGTQNLYNCNLWSQDPEYCHQIFILCSPVLSTGWGFYPPNGQAQCTSALLYRAYRSRLINCWPILNVIELRLPWIGLCLSCKELCQDEIRFYKVPDGCRSHSKALIFQRAIMLGLISSSS